MNTPETRNMDLARAYVDGVQVLLAPPGAPTGERGGRGPVSYTDLSIQAEELAPLSAELTASMAGQLTGEDAAVRSQTETQLLAKALTDLEVSAYLLQCAMDEEDELHWTVDTAAERSSATRGATESTLKILLGEPGADPRAVERAGPAITDPSTARVVLYTTVEDVLALITERAGRTGQVALGGLLGLGVAEVAQAAGVVGMDIARALGRAEQVTRLYSLFRDFALKAYDTLFALLGPHLAQTAAQHVLEWFEKFKDGEHFGQLLEKLYETEATGQELKALVVSSQSQLKQLQAAIEGVSSLEGAYRQKVTLAENLLNKMKFLGILPVAVLPQGKLLLAAAYLVLGGFVVLAGADYVDARRLQLLDRVKGVRQLLEEMLLVDA